MATAHRTFVIGSRGSQLALFQAEWVRERLAGAHPDAEFTVKVIATTGDVVLDRPLPEVGGKGVFTKEIEDALVAREIDLAVHSLKDVPTGLPPGLEIAAVTRREDVRDVFIPHPKSALRTIDELPAGSVIATGSLRRRSQIMSWNRGFKVVDLRGNLATRFSKLGKSHWAGMVLAKAGVVRLGLEDTIGETIDIANMMPAVGQGALGHRNQVGRTGTRRAALGDRERGDDLRHGGRTRVPREARGRMQGADRRLRQDRVGRAAPGGPGRVARRKTGVPRQRHRRARSVRRRSAWSSAATLLRQRRREGARRHTALIDADAYRRRT